MKNITGFLEQPGSRLKISSGPEQTPAGGIHHRRGSALYTAMVLFVLVTVFMALSGGCVPVGPDYVAPGFNRMPGRWTPEMTGGMSAVPLDSKALASWWIVLDDPVLTGLITRAIDVNLDLRKTRAVLREARARLLISGTDAFPTIKTDASAVRRYQDDESGSSYNAGFDAFWEMDVFGRVQRAREAATADLEADQESMGDVRVSLVAEVALNYIGVRSFQARLAIAQKSLAVQEETLQLTQWQRQAGLTSQLDVEQARSSLEETRASVPDLQTGLGQVMNQLALLLGQYPGTLYKALSVPAPVPVAPMEIAVGVPAEVLRRIPTVRQAERQLAAQTARVGVATAEQYPQFTLNGSIGFDALSIHDLLFESASRIFSIGPAFSWTLFDAGRLRQNIEVQNALTQQAAIEYEKAVLTALKDVEDALVAYGGEQVRRQSLLGASTAQQDALDLARDQYASGMVNFQVVLDAQRSLLSLQNQLAVSNGAVTSDLIRLYKALGGGWTPLSASGATKAH
ncbi:RND efflux transporter, outer membrane lipoprotein [Desulforapulum autotrophicum HRM2]|uniref:RND efflux transporter, outer membrane lipoprotein n=1 Tax=Desulforapulum autotrophicum (strain ATCC 43914 / DSM 3382 / VKM B-1955 / HRM2) TaxID=177437 RepID=C0QAF2_DESAH|nr:efflux transporter outer membrane subunit [Desulforapulum autotrophicum]ACN14737.1 RND efflux transporter, outer membrane lipoprotein [Desulforapulum autotrophicum HRM2]